MKYTLKTRNAGQVVLLGRVLKIVKKISRKFVRWEVEIQTKTRSGNGDFFQNHGDVILEKYDENWKKNEVFEELGRFFLEEKTKTKEYYLEKSRFEREYKREVMRNLGV